MSRAGGTKLSVFIAWMLSCTKLIHRKGHTNAQAAHISTEYLVICMLTWLGIVEIVNFVPLSSCTHSHSGLCGHAVAIRSLVCM